MPPALREILDEAEAALAPEGALPVVHGLARRLRELRADLGDAAWAAAAPEARQHAVAARLREDPLTARALARPRGYAGDAVALDYMYGGLPATARQTTSRLGRAIFAWTAGCSAAAVATRQRRNVLAHAIDETAATVPGARILAVGSGHLREARDSRAVQAGSLGQLVAVDADPECLRVVARECDRRVVRVVEAGPLDLAAGRVDLGAFDLVYTSGLLERIDDDVAGALTAALLRALRPGGRLLLSNFVDGFLAQEYMQAFMDWHVACRDERALLALVGGASRAARSMARTWRDATGCVAWLELRRPGR